MSADVSLSVGHRVWFTNAKGKIGEAQVVLIQEKQALCQLADGSQDWLAIDGLTIDPDSTLNVPPPQQAPAPGRVLGGAPTMSAGMAGGVSVTQQVNTAAIPKPPAPPAPRGATRAEEPSAAPQVSTPAIQLDPESVGLRAAVVRGPPQSERGTPTVAAVPKPADPFSLADGSTAPYESTERTRLSAGADTDPEPQAFAMAAEAPPGAIPIRNPNLVAVPKVPDDSSGPTFISAQDKSAKFTIRSSPDSMARTEISELNEVSPAERDDESESSVEESSSDRPETKEKVTGTIPDSPGFGRGQGFAMPMLESRGHTLLVDEHEAPGTAVRIVVGVAAAVLVLVGACVLSVGTGLVAFPIMLRLAAKRRLAIIRTGALEVSDHQFGEFHQCIEAYAKRLDLRPIPPVYIVRGSRLKDGDGVPRGAIVLFDEDVSVALSSSLPACIQFFIATELARHALGQATYLRGVARTLLPSLARLDQLNADRVALALTADYGLCVHALTLQMVGAQLMDHVDTHTLIRQATTCCDRAGSTMAERRLPTPPLLRRIYELGQVR
ncbi:MAG: hypothetical protein HRU17_04925 [Polyangiaceae bacterium]|nr:hypothetical protein [Polyangiaceae bacterium]